MDKNFFTNLCPHKNVNFKFWFPVSKEYNYGKFLSNIKSNDSFKIKIVLAFQKCLKLQSYVPQELRNCMYLGGLSIAKHPVVA